MTSDVAVEATIHGRVQGVYFRGWTQEQAARYGLRGWVRNNADGTVTALFAGPSEIVAAMLRDCEDGPRHAAVTRVETAAVDPVPVLDRFTIRR